MMLKEGVVGNNWPHLLDIMGMIIFRKQEVSQGNSMTVKHFKGLCYKPPTHILQNSPVYVYSDISSTMFSGGYSQVSVRRIAT